MNRSTILWIDALISLVLGVVLVAFPKSLVDFLGVPPTETTFYRSIMGAVVIGIAIALLIESRRRPNGVVGLGLGGAIAIDLCAALVLAGWLTFGDMNLPVRGNIILWGIVVVLFCVSGLGLLTIRKQQHREQA